MVAAGSGAAAPSGNAAAPDKATDAKPSDAKPSDAKPGTAEPSKPSDNPAKDPGTDNKPATQPPASDPNKDPGTGATPMIDPNADYPDLRGKCGIKSAYPGDETCISAPAAEEGMQLHVGPKNYDDQAEVAKYIMNPGEESSLCWTFHTPNTEKIYYQTSVLSGRAGTHHIINTMYPGDALQDAPFGRCGDSMKAIGGIPGASRAYMPRTHVAPEYAHVGKSIPANAAITSDMHYFNFTEKPLIREYWMNLYYAKAEDITEEAQQIRGMGGFGWNSAPIAPGTDMVFKYACPVKGDGYILNLLGHYHAHGKRFTSFIQRKSGGEPEKVFEMYDYQDPATFEYNTVVKNPTFSTTTPGAVTGRLAISDGDTLMWECHIVNDSEVALKYVNEVKTGEMCNLWGTSLGITKFDCLKQ